MGILTCPHPEPGRRLLWTHVFHTSLEGASCMPASTSHRLHVSVAPAMFCWTESHSIAQAWTELVTPCLSPTLSDCRHVSPYLAHLP